MTSTEKLELAEVIKELATMEATAKFYSIDCEDEWDASWNRGKQIAYRTAKRMLFEFFAKVEAIEKEEKNNE